MKFQAQTAGGLRAGKAGDVDHRSNGSAVRRTRMTSHSEVKPVAAAAEGIHA